MNNSNFLKSDKLKKIVKLFFELSKNYHPAYFVARFQYQKAIEFKAVNGNFKKSSFNIIAGIGIQTFTPNGGFGFSCSDNFTNIEDLMKKSFEIATKLDIYKLSDEYYKILINLPINKEKEAKILPSLMDVNIEELKRDFMKIHITCLNKDNNISLNTEYNSVFTEWRILRSDTSDVYFIQNLNYLNNKITATDNKKKATVNVKIPWKDVFLLKDDRSTKKIKKKTELGIKEAKLLCNAPKIQTGNYKIVIDYALAKGLVHEAFGHAVSGSNINTSCLSENKFFTINKKLTNDNISVIDQTIFGDHAYQPYSSYGIPRNSFKIIDRGVFKEPLLDLVSSIKHPNLKFSSDRIEAYYSIPQSRMSNISLIVENSIPLPDNLVYDDITPEILRDILLKNNLISNNEKILFLSGYKGGQVKSSIGTFVFNPRIIYDLTNENIVVYKPGPFAGSTFSALNSIIAAIGDVLNDAMGFCIQNTQRVTSSGGSNAFLILQSNKEITIGGKNVPSSDEDSN